MAPHERRGLVEHRRPADGLGRRLIVGECDRVPGRLFWLVVARVERRGDDRRRQLRGVFQGGSYKRPSQTIRAGQRDGQLAQPSVQHVQRDVADGLGRQVALAQQIRDRQIR
jgi:hypothetical protein